MFVKGTSHFLYQGFNIINLDDFTDEQIKPALKGLAIASSMIRNSGFSKLLYGDIIFSKNVEEEKDAGNEKFAGGHYHIGKDLFVIYPEAEIWKDPLHALQGFVHELGHRYYFKVLSKGSRLKWIESFGLETEDWESYQKNLSEANTISIAERLAWWKIIATKKVWGKPGIVTTEIEKKLGERQGEKFQEWIFFYIGNDWYNYEDFNLLMSREVVLPDDEDLSKWSYKGKIWTAFDLSDKTKLENSKKQFIKKELGKVKVNKLLANMPEPKLKGITDYGSNNASEDFAETFYLYIIKNERIEPNLKLRFERTVRGCYNIKKLGASKAKDNHFFFQGFNIINANNFKDKTLEPILGGIELASKLLKNNGFPNLIYGNIFITKNMDKTTDALGEKSAAASYNVNKDCLTIFPIIKYWTKDYARTILHELGHRHYYRFLSKNSRLKWQESFRKESPGWENYLKDERAFNEISVEEREKWWRVITKEGIWGDAEKTEYAINKKLGKRQTEKFQEWIFLHIGKKYYSYTEFNLLMTVDLKNKRAMNDIKNMFIQSSKGVVPLTIEWSDKIISPKKDTSVSGYGTANDREDYAETFEQYIMRYTSIDPFLKMRFERTIRGKFNVNAVKKDDIEECL